MAKLVPITARQIRNFAPARSRFGQRILNRGGSGFTGPRTGLTWVAAESDFAWARVLYANQTGASITIDKTTLQASASMATLACVDEAGANLPMLPAYANAGGADSKPGELTGTALPLVIPAGTAANDTKAWTDWVKVASRPRADGAFRPLLQVRTYIAGTTTLYNEVDKDVWDDPAVNLGRIIDLFDGGNDQTGAANPTATMSEVIRCYIAGVEFLGPKMVQVVLGIGDSETEGNQSTSGRKNFLHIATAALSRANRPVAHINSGYSAQTTQQFVDRGIGDIRRFNPSVVVFPAFSPNDAPTTMDLARNGWANCLRLLQACREAGAIPIVWTSFPINGRTALQDAPRQWLNNQLRGLRDNGVLIADFDLLISDGGSPPSIKSIFDSGDGLHLKDAGWDACAGVLKPVLNQALG